MYPKATRFIYNMKPSRRSNRAFKKYGQASKADVKIAFEAGKGPLIKLSNLNNANGQFTPNVGSTTLEIDESILIAYETGRKGSATLLKSTIEHELTHYFDDQDGIDFSGEEGQLYEENVYHKDIDNYADAIKYEKRNIVRKVLDLF